MSNQPPLPYYAPNCRRGPHWLIEHHERFAAVVGRECECPCHHVNYTSPWWSAIFRADFYEHAPEAQWREDDQALSYEGDDA